MDRVDLCCLQGREEFRALVVCQESMKRSRWESFIDRIQIFASMNQWERRSLSEAIEEYSNSVIKFSFFVRAFPMHCNFEILNSIFVRLCRQMYEQDTEFICQGEPGDDMFILQEGSVDAWLQDASDGPRVLVKQYVIPGEYFGELCR